MEYALTEKGRALLPIIDDMRAYGRAWLGVDGCAVVVEPAEAAEPAPVAA